MKQQIQIWKTTREKISVEVEFPIYSKHDWTKEGSNCIFFVRREANGTTWHLRHNLEVGEGVSWELEKIHNEEMDQHEDIDYLLGLGKYACSPEEFYTALAEFKEFVTEV